MVKIRLTRTGRKNEPHYRIVVMPEEKKRDGKAIEYVGHYDPRSKQIDLDIERAKYWLSVGAQPTDTVRGMLVKFKLLKALPQKKKVEKKEIKQEKTEKKKEAEPKKEKEAKKKDK
jgi:small subunit ribosomal protein S16